MSTIARKRERDGAGKSVSSWDKHWLIKNLLHPQIAILTMKVGRGGLIVDMHAHDGSGVSLPQTDLFDHNMSESTAAMAERVGRECGCHVVLCESITERRNLLRQRFGELDHVTILRSYNDVPKRIDVASYPWAMVLNDPNGQSKHGEDVLVHIARHRPKSDFIICVNEGALRRHVAVGRDGNDCDKPNARLIAGCRASGDAYAWMLDRDRWRRLLGRRYGASARHLCGSHAYKGRVMLFSNYIGNLRKGVFDQW